ncbi:heme-binding peroxidase [Spathaspora passalidarum NRRL Y-27907]|uniref:Heme-binding peroxidase n=1 Tax=Spathaspora passalidarum (strain NRRL Y-27907 / 11-Y1) TaxID=619300 RepID=G3AGW8_SPAPN|nr:heme-binding peroxidase [Spathaspora passalidarum NRRL Y-27907]EGW34641.1 heme-binding peroxidase [Spathaspora passalidarum NRRL Y-27907]
MSTATQTLGATTKLSQHEIIPAPNDVGALANRINKETRSLHDKIDKVVTLKFAIALKNYKIFRQGLQAFYHVFDAIETSLYQQLEIDDEWTEMFKQVWKPEIARREKAQQDLMFYYDDRKEKFMHPVMSEQVAFANHIKEVTKEKPYLLFAYLHVMYLALFAGGRVMRSSFARAAGFYPRKSGLSHEDVIKMGANFFTFDVADENLFRIIYKRDYELVTRNALTEEQKLEIIEESKYIFAQNLKVVTELEQHNLEKLTKNWTYYAITRGYYVVLFLLLVVIMFYLRKIVLQFI